VREAYKLMPGYRSTRARAAVIVAGSRATFEQLPPWAKVKSVKSVNIPENGIDPQRFDRPRAGPIGKPLAVAFVGRLVPGKGADILLEAALPVIPRQRVVVNVIGDDPEPPRLKALAADLQAGVVKTPGVGSPRFGAAAFDRIRCSWFPQR
jgi:starch synthase